MAKSHPHLENPTREQLVELVREHPPEIVDTYLAFHELVHKVLPTLDFSADQVDAAIGYGAHQYGYNGWGMVALTPFGKWVSLTFLQGSLLDDPEGLLQGSAVMRHIKLETADEVRVKSVEISELLLRASQLHEGVRDE